MMVSDDGIRKYLLTLQDVKNGMTVSESRGRIF